MVSTLGGETVFCTFWGALFPLFSWGVSLLLTLLGFDASKMVANFLNAIACSSPTWQNGPAGCRLSNAWVNSADAAVAKSLDEGNGILNWCGKKSTVSTILLDLVFDM
jgi:hypothetical protein